MRSDKRPLPNDIFNTSAAQQNADLILGLYREDRYTTWPKERYKEPRPAELSILKQRYGEDGWVIPLWWLRDRMVWVEREDK
jgi:replicative DNA helicase